jgi:peroxiredoxin 2/4
MIATFLIIAAITTAQPQKRTSMPLIGETAPAFTAQSTNGTLNFPEDFGRNWKIIFAHPKDFTPVCSSEILELAYMHREFTRRGASLMIVSTDYLDTHFEWKKALEDIPFKGRHKVRIEFPLVEDNNFRIAEQYGMVHPDARRGKNVRGVFFIDRDNKIRAITMYPVEVGRNTDEILRTLVALQEADDDFNVSTPANWVPGEPVMISYPTPIMMQYMNQANSLYYQYAWFMTYRKPHPKP